MNLGPRLEKAMLEVLTGNADPYVFQLAEGLRGHSLELPYIAIYCRDEREATDLAFTGTKICELSLSVESHAHRSDDGDELTLNTHQAEYQKLSLQVLEWPLNGGPFASGGTSLQGRLNATVAADTLGLRVDGLKLMDKGDEVTDDRFVSAIVLEAVCVEPVTFGV